MQVVAGPAFEADEFATHLTRNVVPALLKTPASESQTNFLAFANNSPDRHTRALLAATREFTPPEGLPGRDTAHAIFMGIVALRAATPEYLRNPDLETRYEAAASWVCDNLGVLIWWNCNK